MKAIRTDAEAYEQGADFSVTIATAGRHPFLADAMLVETCLIELKSAATKYAASVYAYCFMPDHLHLLTSVASGTSLINFIRYFKQLTAYRFRRFADYEGTALWQRRFYDHALRREEHLSQVADYIWANPVRAGLVSDASRYPYSGSLVWEVSFVSGSEDPDLQRAPPQLHVAVGEGLQTLASPY